MKIVMLSYKHHVDLHGSQRGANIETMRNCITE